MAQSPPSYRPALAAALLCSSLLCWALLTGCGGEESAPPQADSAGSGDTGAGADGVAYPDAALDAGTDAGPLTARFTFAVLADPHVVSKSKNHDRLVAAVAWINEEAAARDIQLVLVLGDIAWGAGLDIGLADLAALQVPWVPIIGDNEIAAGSEVNYAKTFAPQFEKLATELEDFVHAPMPVTAADGQALWLQNMAFNHAGVRFVGLDTAARIKHPILSEQGWLHDVAGGTWPWFAGEMSGAETLADESVILFSHIPMHTSPGGFDTDEMAQITALLAPVGDKIYAHFSGHYHGDLTVEVPDAGYTAFVTDATWDDEVRVRLVKVSGNGAGFAYEHELIDVPWQGP